MREIERIIENGREADKETEIQEDGETEDSYRLIDRISRSCLNLVVKYKIIIES